VSGSTVRFDFQGGESPPELKRNVQVGFDDRLSLQEVIRLLRRYWPNLRTRGFVRTTHPLEKRKVELLRHVCLNAQNVSWGERLRRWNQKHPEGRYRDTRAMITACRDAAESLTGYRNGLAWFYDKMVRMPRVELKALADGGDTAAKREWSRRRKVWSAIVRLLNAGERAERGKRFPGMRASR
jgi:hypothetical protein